MRRAWLLYLCYTGEAGERTFPHLFSMEVTDAHAIEQSVILIRLAVDDHAGGLEEARK